MAVVCEICEKLFAQKSTLNRHIIEVHNKQDEDKVANKKYNSNYRCLEANCGVSFQNNKNLMDHLKEHHSQEFEMNSFYFDNLHDFEVWKSNIEISSTSTYVFKSKSSSITGKVHYYYCNRNRKSYNVLSNKHQQRKRLLKSQGSCKMDSSCTSQIRLILQNNKVRAEWQKTHYGHTVDLQHIRIPKIEKQCIALKLNNGVTATRILEMARDNIEDNLKRVDLYQNSRSEINFSIAGFTQESS